MLKLSKSNLKSLSEICRDIGQTLFAVWLTGVVVLSLDAAKLFVLILELGFAIGFWYLSLYFAERGKL